MKNVWPTVVVLSALLLSACATKDSAVDSMPRLQQLEINSASEDSIVDYEICYGDHQAPLLRDRAFSGGPENILRRVSETLTAPIPTNAAIKWKTGDGRVRHAFVPIRDLVADVGAFHGVKILFVGDHVDLYFIYKLATQSRYLNLKYVKAYSSASEK